MQAKIVKKDFLNSAGLTDLLVPAMGIKNITLLPSANCISARPAYTIVSKSGHNETREIVKGKNTHEVLKCTHILISNAKSFNMRTFQSMREKLLQAYLDGFWYRFNRRKWRLHSLID